MVGILQLLSLLSLYMAGPGFELCLYYNASMLVAAALFGYHLYLIRGRQPAACFKAFLHNNWVGMAIFVGVVLDYMAGGA